MEQAALMPDEEFDDSEATVAVRAEFVRQHQSRPWVMRHPGVAMTMVGSVIGALLSLVQVYTANVVGKAVGDEQTRAYRDGKAQEIVDMKGAAEAEHKSLRTSIRDVGKLTIEQGRSNRTILKDLAEARGVSVKDKSKDLTDAEAKVEAIE